MRENRVRPPSKRSARRLRAMRPFLIGLVAARVLCAQTGMDGAGADPPEGAEGGGRTAAAVSVVPGEEFRERAAQGQLPLPVAAATGADVLQTAAWDFAADTCRAYGDALGGRTVLLLDGRDPATPFLDAQEWPAFPIPLDDVSRVELVRGPAGSRYGPNAANGVLRLLTRPPADTGGAARIVGGEESTFGGDLRWAHPLGRGWFGKLTATARGSDSFTVARTGAAEYSRLCPAPAFSVPPLGVPTDCLPAERVAPPTDEVESFGGALRLDGPVAGSGHLVFETGASSLDGSLLLTDLGRVLVSDADRSWTRISLATPHWRLLGTYDGREADRQLALATGQNLVFDEERWKGEVETTWGFLGERLRLVAGASFEDERVGTAADEAPLRPTVLNPRNRETLLFQEVITESQGAWAELAWDATDDLRLVLGGRYDDSEAYDVQWSPRAAAVLGLGDHVLRLGYSAGFSAPSVWKRDVQADVAAPLNLSALELICIDLAGLACGFDADFGQPGSAATADTRLMLVGNRDLEVEEVDSLELGYAGTYGGQVSLAAVYHRSRHENLIVGPLPQLGTSLGRIHSGFGAWAPAPELIDPALRQRLLAALLPELQAALGPLLPFLTNNVDTTPFLALFSYANVGEVDTQGIDLDLDWRAASGLSMGLAYSWFDFEVERAPAGLASWLTPNAPEHRAALELRYSHDRFDTGATYRWVDGFRWVDGLFQGDVESYGVLDLALGVRLGDRWSLGLDVANATDEEHWELFGGDLLRRRSVGHLTVHW